MFTNVTSSVCQRALLSFSALGVRYYAQVGFIGLGNMGGSMAINLAKAGHQVTCYDLSSQLAEGVVSNSGGKAKSVSKVTDVVKGNSAVITMLPSSKEVLDVYLGDSGLLAAATKGVLFIDSTTGDPETCAQVAVEAKKLGVSYIDAPVSGGVMAAKNAQLTFMCGGPKKSFEQAEEFLKCMGKKSIHCGDKVGSGEIAKICNNMLLGISMIGTSEAMSLGIQLGLDEKKLAEVINASSGRCWSSEIYNPVPGVVPGVPSSNNYQGGFLCSLMAKDLRLSQEVAAKSRALTPFGALANQLYNLLCNHGYAKQDFSVVFKYLKEASK